MLALISIGCLAGSVVLAAWSLRRPDQAARLELWSGLCLLAGLGLLGIALRTGR